MKTLTEKVNGRREWSFYGLEELDRNSKREDEDAEIFKAIIVSNALQECGLKPVYQGSHLFWLNKKIFLRVTKKGHVIVAKHLTDSEHTFIEMIEDPKVIFDRIRIIWGNHA